MINRISLKIHLTKNTFFFIALYLFMINLYLNNSALSTLESWSALSRIIIYIVFACICVKLLMGKRYTISYFFTLVLLIAILILVYFFAGYRNLLVSVLLILSGIDCEFDKIAKSILKIHILMTLLIVFSCLANIIPNYSYIRDDSTVYSWGFLYYSGFGYSIMIISMLYLYVRRKACSCFELGVVLAINVLLFFVHTTRLSFCMTMVYCIVYFFVNKIKIKIFTNKIIAYLGVASPVICFISTWFLVYLYSIGKMDRLTNSSFWTSVLTRLKYSLIALENYPISLFGNSIIMSGVYSTTYKGASSGFYIDSGYVYTLLAYGIVFTVIFISMYCILFLYLYKSKNEELFLFLIIMIVACIVNNFFDSILYNPVLFMIPTAISAISKGERAPNIIAS